MDLTSLFPFDWAEITSTEPAGGVKLAVVSVVPAFLTTAGVEASSASPAAAAGFGAPATSPTNASATLTTNKKSTRACDFIRSPWNPRGAAPPGSPREAETTPPRGVPADESLQLALPDCPLRRTTPRHRRRTAV